MVDTMEDTETPEDETTEPLVIDDAIDIAQISFNAIAGISDHTTMRVKGMHQKRVLFILIDSGSTHNFIDRKVAEKLGLRMLPVGNSRVKVADGNKIGVHAKVEKFCWNIQGTTFQSDIMVIPLGGFDMVLGVQWLKQFGPITWDFQTLEMQFK